MYIIGLCKVTQSAAVLFFLYVTSKVTGQVLGAGPQLKPPHRGVHHRRGPLPSGEHRAPFLREKAKGNSLSRMLQWWEAFSSGCFSEPPPAVLITGPGAALWAHCALEKKSRVLFSRHTHAHTHKTTTTKKSRTHIQAAWARANTRAPAHVRSRPPEPAEPVCQLRVTFLHSATSAHSLGRRELVSRHLSPSQTSRTRDYVKRRPSCQTALKLFVWQHKAERREQDRNDGRLSLDSRRHRAHHGCGR